MTAWIEPVQDEDVGTGIGLLKCVVLVHGTQRIARSRERLCCIDFVAAARESRTLQIRPSADAVGSLDFE